MTALLSLSGSDAALRLAAAAALGAALGVEREMDGHDAGVRTHALLALGAGIFGVLSVGAFGSFIADTASSNVRVDVTRIASYVAAGVGFLGGGAIVKGPDRVRGLTTAASLWVAAAVGLAAGLGFWAGAVAGAVLALATLLADRPLGALRERFGRPVTVVEIGGSSVEGDDGLVRVLAFAADARVDIRRESGGSGPGDLLLLEVHGLRRADSERFVAAVAALPAVRSVTSRPGGKARSRQLR